MTFAPENLGLQPTGLALLRDLVHERTGLFYDETKFEMFADRIARWSSNGGSARFSTSTTS